MTSIFSSSSKELWDYLYDQSQQSSSPWLVSQPITASRCACRHLLVATLSAASVDPVVVPHMSCHVLGLFCQQSKVALHGVLQLESDELSRILGFEPGKYVIRGVTRNAPRVERPPLPDGKRRPGRPRKLVSLQPSTDHQQHDLFSAS